MLIKTLALFSLKHSSSFTSHISPLYRVTSGYRTFSTVPIKGKAKKGGVDFNKFKEENQYIIKGASQTEDQNIQDDYFINAKTEELTDKTETIDHNNANIEPIKQASANQGDHDLEDLEPKKVPLRRRRSFKIYKDNEINKNNLHYQQESYETENVIQVEFVDKSKVCPKIQ